MIALAPSVAARAAIRAWSGSVVSAERGPLTMALTTAWIAPDAIISAAGKAKDMP